MLAVLLFFCLASFAWAQNPTVSGEVRDAATMEPVIAEVELIAPDGATTSSQTDESGNYEFSAPEGATSVEVVVLETAVYARQNYPGINAGEIGQGAEVDLSGGDVSGIDFDLVPGFVISGLAVDASGDPVAASVQLIRRVDNQMLFIGGRGEEPNVFKSERVVPGDYKAIISQPGSLDQPAEFIDQLYPDIQCIQGLCDIESLGDEIQLVNEDVDLGAVTLSSGSVIEGTVTELDGGSAVPDGSVSVQIFNTDGHRVAGFGLFDPDVGGRYVSPALPPDNYKIRFDSSVYLSQFFGDSEPCASDCDPSINGPEITLDSSSNFTADIALSRGGRLTGSMVDDDSGATLDGRMQLLFTNGDFVRPFDVSDGVLDVDGLSPGIYKAGFRSDGYLSQLYDGITCPDLNCDRSALGTTFEIVSGQTTDLGEVRLDRGASIGGTLTGSDNEVVQEAWVRLYDPDGDFLASSRADENGEYLFDGLAAGEYRLKVEPDSDYLPKLYQGRDCETSCPPDEGDPINVAAGETKVIDMTLLRGGALSGLMVDAFEDDVVLDGRMNVLFSNGDFALTFDVSDGVLDRDGLSPGTYKLAFRADGYVDQLYDGVACPDLRCDRQQLGKTFELVSGETKDLGMVGMVPEASIGGSLTGSDGPVVQEAWVRLYDPVGNFVASSRADENGEYLFDGLAAGEYRLKVEPDSDYLPKLYQGRDCERFCPPDEGDPINVEAGETKVIDMTLQRGFSIVVNAFDKDSPEVPVETACLEIWLPGGQNIKTRCAETTDGRFEVPGLLPGEYKVQLDPYGDSVRYARTLYDGITCFPFCNISEQGTVVSLGEEDLELDLAVESFNLLSGVITDTSDNPLRDIQISALPVSNNEQVFLGSSFSEDGSYAVRIPDGEFVIQFRPFGVSNRYVPQLYRGVTCTPLGCDRAAAESFVIDGEDLSDINPQLELGARVSGSIARRADNEPVRSGPVLFSEDQEAQWGTGSFDGNYEFAAVPPGDYWLAVRSFETEPVLIDQLYEAAACRDLDCDFEEAGKLLTLEKGDDLQIDFSLEDAPTQIVSGIVLDRDTGDRLSDSQVDVFWRDLRVPFRTVDTDSEGQFSVDLPAGEFGLVIEQDGYITRSFGSFFGPEGWCSARRCQDFPGQRFTVSEEAIEAAGPIDLGEFPMDPGALITGTLALPEGAPVDPWLNVSLRVFDEDGVEVPALRLLAMRSFIPDPAGTFEVQVPPGRWHLLFEASSLERSLVATALGDRLCPQGSCGMETTAAVEVGQGDALTEDDSSRLAVTMIDGIPLTGSLIDAENEINLEQGSVYFYNDQGRFVGSASQFQGGPFQTGFGLPDGTFYASTRFIGPGFSGSGVPSEFEDLVYKNRSCVGECDVTEGTPIEVELEADFLPPPIEFELFRGVSISGSVQDADSEPVTGQVELFDEEGRLVPGALIDSDDGSFTVDGLLPGDYYLRTRNSAGLEDQLWNVEGSIPCDPSCPTFSGTPITVAAGDTVENIDFVLFGASSISGTTRGSDDGPLAGITVEVYNAIGEQVGSARSDEAGEWEVDSLPSGAFFVRTRNNLGLVNVAWEDIECTGCDITSTSSIELGRGESRSDIELVMDTGAELRGTVTRLADDEPVAGVNVDVFNSAGRLIVSDRTGSNGVWSVDGLAEGTYLVATRSSVGLVNQVHDGQNCIGDCDVTSGAPVELTIGQSTSIDFVLEATGRVEGRVVDTEDEPIAAVFVQAFSPDGRLLREALTSSDGGYEIRGLAAGEVFLRTRADGNYTDQTFDGRDCIPVCDVTGSNPVTVIAGESLTGKDFTLTFGGGLTGLVSRVDDQSARSVSVEIYNSVGSLVGTPRTRSDGTYSLRGLPGGRYFARTRNSSDLVDQVYDGIGCTPGPCVTGLGTPLEVAGGLIEDVDFNLDVGTSFSVDVTDQFGNPVPSGQLVLFDDRGREVRREAVANSEWRLTGIADGTYYLVALNGSGLIDELYQRRPCPGGRCDVTEGTPIVIGEADVAPESLVSRSKSGRVARAADDGPIVFELQRGSRIRGRVEAPDETALSNVTVWFFNDQGDPIGSSRTDGLGEFVSESAFSPGDYYVATTDGETRGVTAGGFVNVVYDGDDDLACPLECDVTMATSIELDGQFDKEGIVLRTLAGGALAGEAIDTLDDGLTGAIVEVFDAEGRLVGQTTVGTSGRWTVDGLPDGAYTVVLRNDLVAGFDDYVVGSGFCDGTCDPAEGTTFTLEDGQPDSDVDVIFARDDVIFQSRFQ